MIVANNGTELMSNAILKRAGQADAERVRVELQRTPRDEYLNERRQCTEGRSFHQTPPLFLQNSPGSSSAGNMSGVGLPKMAPSYSWPYLERHCPIHGDLQSFSRCRAMAGRAFDPRSVHMAQARISAMGADQATQVLTDVEAKQLAVDDSRLSAQDY
ncbi:hypothetical protein GGE07_006316 [Sinorhizobium terangae]|nr:hypothetical protein [Sinorhizobium terangae]